MLMIAPLLLFGSLGMTELLVILAILLLIFGAAKLPQRGGALGKTIRNFKDEMKDGQAPPLKCPKCDAEITDPAGEFCPKCGQKVK